MGFVMCDLRPDRRAGLRPVIADGTPARGPRTTRASSRPTSARTSRGHGERRRRPSTTARGRRASACSTTDRSCSSASRCRPGYGELAGRPTARPRRRRRRGRRPARRQRRRQDHDPADARRRAHAARRRGHWTGAATTRRRCTTAAASGLGYLTEERSVFMGLTARENLRSAACDRGEALALFPELDEHLGPPGRAALRRQQQMLALARALGRDARGAARRRAVARARPACRRPLLAAVRAAADERGVGVLLVEQHVRKALAVADRVYVLARGKVVMSCSAAEAAADVTRSRPPTSPRRLRARRRD